MKVSTLLSYAGGFFEAVDEVVALEKSGLDTVFVPMKSEREDPLVDSGAVRGLPRQRLDGEPLPRGATAAGASV